MTKWTFVSKVISLLFNTLSRFVIAFLQRSKGLLMDAVTIHSDFGAQENRVSHCFHLFPVYLPWSDRTGCHDLFLNVILHQLFHFPLSFSSRRSLVPLCFLPWGWRHLHIWGCWYFSQLSWFQLELHSAQHFVWCTHKLNKQGDDNKAMMNSFPNFEPVHCSHVQF